MLMVDCDGKRLEVILLDRGRGPLPWIRVSWRGYLVGPGYYQDIEEALRQVDAKSLVEVIALPAAVSRQHLLSITGQAHPAQGGAVGKKDEPEKQACSGCNGEGGGWVVPNGNGFKKRTWVNCSLCHGDKYV